MSSARKRRSSGLAEFVALPGESGELGILPGHMPLMTRIKPGAVRLKLPNQQEEELVFVAGRILRGTTGTRFGSRRYRNPWPRPGRSEGIGAKSKAEEALKNQSSKLDYARAQSELAEAIAQLAAIQRLRKRGH